MIRALRNTAAALAATALVSLPTSATAADWGNGSAPVFVVNNVHQTALGDIFNAGHDNTVGSNDASQGTPGVGVGVGVHYTFFIQVGGRVGFLVGTIPSQDWPGVLSGGGTFQVNVDAKGEAVYQNSVDGTAVTLLVDPASPDPLQCGPTMGVRCEVRGNRFLIN
ncbi:hypothetical protein [Streptacidiphilus fuscans]|uniref:Secreted protein n=1 Tax=Streptacidiphilus fuscans TaxID=2789292 RepID=A0A931B0C8_9ACTN|nr:hypothetical protein [Streptacidiphilus fuscans]MBF9068006.1 hypothetical protein [Streptacidiphilus fuscans]